MGVGTDNQAYYKAWWGKLVTTYPNRGTTIFIGITNPNSAYLTIGYWYGSNSVDLKNGRPIYCGILSFRYGPSAFFCGYDNSTWFYKSINVS